MNSKITIYHNPRCSKSRKTLDIIKSKNIEPKIILYLESKLSKAEIKDLLSKLRLSIRDILRTGEVEYKKNNPNEIYSISNWYKDNFFIEPTEKNISKVFEL